MKVTVIGAGNMGGALAKGWARAAAAKGEEKLEVCVTARSQSTLDRLKADCPALSVSLSNAEAVAGADLVVIAVKPWMVENVVLEIKKSIDYANQTVVSVAAGVSIEQLSKMFARKVWSNIDYDDEGNKVGRKESEARAAKDGTPDAPHAALPSLFYVMPNIAAEYGESMTFVAPSHGVDDEKVRMVSELFALLGKVNVCEERMVAPGMMMAGCGIAYVMRFVRAMMEGGVEMGFYPADARNIALQTMRGAVAVLEETGMHPEAAIDKVTTPGGYTIKGLNELEHSGFASAVIKSLKAGLEK
jgi:pyrroline-5-carboxylate reductase